METSAFQSGDYSYRISYGEVFTSNSWHACCLAIFMLFTCEAISCLQYPWDTCGTTIYDPRLIFGTRTSQLNLINLWRLCTSIHTIGTLCLQDA